MKKYKILLVSSAFYPELSPRSFRATELAKEFIREGHELTVIIKSRDYDYSSFLKEYSVNLKMWNNSTFMNVPKVNIKQIDFLLKGLYLKNDKKETKLLNLIETQLSKAA